MYQVELLDRMLTSV
jgi:hypothetical protein